MTLLELLGNEEVRNHRFLLLAALLSFARFQARSRLVQQLDEGYQKVRRGMDAGDVGVLMKQNTVEALDDQSREDLSGWWDITPLEATETARIQSAFRYTAPRFFRTVRFVFTFDANDKLVGKHRLN